MTAQTLLYIIIGVILSDFLLERFLDILNRSRWSDSLPESLKGIYDQEKYSKQQNYERVKFKFRQVASTFNLLIMLLIMLLLAAIWLQLRVSRPRRLIFSLR